MDVKLMWIFLLIPFVIFVAWIALKYFDEPVRAWLPRRYGIKPRIEQQSDPINPAKLHDTAIESR